MKCSKVLDYVYQFSGGGSGIGDSMPLLNQIQVWFHVFFCHDCAEKIEQLERTNDIMKEDFFPALSKTSGFDSWREMEDSIMVKIAVEEEPEVSYANAGSLSMRGWVIAGVLIFVSFITAFFGFDFQNVARESGGSFLIPVGITIGIVLTIYGALFIGSNLEELSERFGL